MFVRSLDLLQLPLWNSRYGYCWQGGLHTSCGGVGILVATAWSSMVKLVNACGPPSPRRLLFVCCNTLLVTAVYAPYVGAIPSHQHRCFLQETLDIAQATAIQHGLGALWLMGDFNLRGIAPGNSAPPRLGSCHASIAAEFRDNLRAAGLTALETAATQRRGGGLDVHMTNTTPLGPVGLYDAPPGCPSDHKISSVAAMHMSPTGQSSHVSDIFLPNVLVFNWERDQAKWEAAWRKFGPLCKSVSSCLHYVAATATSDQLPQEKRKGLSHGCQAIVDVVCCLAGLSKGLLTTSAQRVGAKRTASASASRARHYMLADLAGSLEAARSAAAAAPGNASLAYNVTYLESWLDTAMLAHPPPLHSRPPLHASWLQAVSQGEVALQRWLSTVSRLSPLRIPMDDCEKARVLVEFRARVGRLDPRCDAQAEQAAVAKTRDLHRKHSNLLAAGRCPPTIFAPDARHLQCPAGQSVHGSYNSLFVTPATISALILKRPNKTASACLPWAALRALTVLGNEFLGIIHGCIECTWACADLDDDSIAIEIAHAYKGGQKPVKQHSSFRPLGQAHPLCSIRSDVLRIRIAPGLASLAGPIQLGGLRDGRAAVVARQEAAARRRHMQLPNIEPNVDARFGFDGGRHSRFLANVSQAGAGSTDWLLCHRLLSGHRMRIRQCDQRGCVATLPDVPNSGGGSIQGLSCSGPMYKPIPIECEVWICAAVPWACTTAHPALLCAYHMSKTSEPSGMWMGSTDAVCAAAWHIESLLEHASPSPCQSSLILDIASIMAQLSTDAERLLVLDMLGSAEGDATTAYVDDLKDIVSSPWALGLWCKALSEGAAHLGLVYECGDAGKTTVVFEGVPEAALVLAPLHLAGTVQGGSPYIVTDADMNPCLGVLDGRPTLRPDGSAQSNPTAANQAVRLRILRCLG
jgi:hypothetical protein